MDKPHLQTNKKKKDVIQSRTIAKSAWCRSELTYHRVDRNFLRLSIVVLLRGLFATAFDVAHLCATARVCGSGERREIERFLLLLEVEVNRDRMASRISLAGSRDHPPVYVYVDT